MLRFVLPVLLFLAACAPQAPPATSETLVNPAHLDYLTEQIVRDADTLAITHIYAEYPDYAYLADDDEGAACVDDAARAAVFYLQHFELTGRTESLHRARHLLNFVLYMQAEDGVWWNFVWDHTLRINTEHENSLANGMTFWAARAIWALGEGVRVLHSTHPADVARYEAALERALPALDGLLANYGTFDEIEGRRVPAWLVQRWAADATSEMLLGLMAWQQARPNDALAQRIDRFAEGIAALHAPDARGALLPWATEWHAWGSTMGQALAHTRFADVARTEAHTFFPWLIASGWAHSFPASRPDSIRTFEQIAYGVRPVVASLVLQHERQPDDNLARMAGLAAAWLTGANVLGQPMYDAATGRGFDGISNPTTRNTNSGAESTIEALIALLYAERVPEARRWLGASIAPTSDGAGRVFTAPDGTVCTLTPATSSCLDS